MDANHSFKDMVGRRWLTRWALVAASVFVALPAAAQTYIQMTSPANNLTLTAPASVTVTAEALDIVNVGAVKIYQGTTVITQWTGIGQNSIVVSNLGVGDYAFRATAVRIGSGGGTQSTPTYTVHVVAPGGNLPTVSVNAPTGAPFIGPATLNFTANAADSDGYVASVQYFANGSPIGSATAAPYAVSWGGVGPGTYSITATATDNNGHLGSSAARAVTVAQSVIYGTLEGLARTAEGEYRVVGWSCSTGRAAPVDVHMYLGGPAASGTYAGAMTANLASEPSIAAACQATGAAYRFSLPLPDSLRTAYPEQPIFVHGLSPAGAASPLLTNSGNFIVPRMPAALSHARKYVYDDNQRLCKVIEPETGATVMGYDAVDNPVWTARGLALPSLTSCDRDTAAASGRAVSQTFDARKRVKSIAFPDGNGNQTWQYTPDGLPSQVVTLNDGGTTQVINGYSYDHRRNLTSESVQQPGWYTWSLGYAYNGNGSLAGQTYPTGLYVDYAPNALGQATKAGTYATAARYYPNGALAQFTYGNGLTHTMIQNARQLPARSIDSGGALDNGYTYDASGNTTQIDDYGDANRTRYMAYDGLDRLRQAGSVSFGGDHWWRYTYDGLDNLKSSRLAGVRQYTNYYDANNRLTNAQDDSGNAVLGLAYDVQGNLSNKNGQGFAFDYGNRLRSAPNLEAYRYDALGRRVSAIRSNGSARVTNYGRSGQIVYLEDSADNQAIEYVFLAGSQVAARNRNTVSNAAEVVYQHTDALGSLVASSNGAGSISDRILYEPFGQSSGQHVDRPGYAGHVMDQATGLTYMQQRYYDPLVGRFLSVDPVSATSSMGFNRYEYSTNNPYKFIDPDGRQACGKDTTCRLNQGETGGVSGTLRRPQGSASASLPGAGATSGSAGPSAQPGQPDSAGSTADAALSGLRVAGLSWATLFAILNQIPGDSARIQQKDTMVIGEGMNNRVIPFALSTGSHYYVPAVGTPQNTWMPANRLWINEMMDRNYKIIDIGPSSAREDYPLPTSRYYKMELHELERRGYPVYKVAVP